MSGGDKAGGYRLRRVIDEALARSDRVTNVTELCEAASVNRNTFYAWTTGKAAPSTGKLVEIARVLDTPVATLLAAYEGSREMAPSTEEALMRVADEVGQLKGEMQVLIRKLDLITNNAVALSVAQALQEQMTQPLGPRREPSRKAVEDVRDFAAGSGAPPPKRSGGPTE